MNKLLQISKNKNLIKHRYHLGLLAPIFHKNMMIGDSESIKINLTRNKFINKETKLLLIKDRSPNVRSWIAGEAILDEDLQLILANDLDLIVRWNLAENNITDKVRLMLVNDKDQMRALPFYARGRK